MPILHKNKNTKNKTPQDVFIANIRFKGENLHVLLKEGAELTVPIWWYPRLQKATAKQRARWELCAGGRGVHWPELDEDLDAHGFIYGLKSPGAKPPTVH